MNNKIIKPLGPEASGGPIKRGAQPHLQSSWAPFWYFVNSLRYLELQENCKASIEKNPDYEPETTWKLDSTVKTSTYIWIKINIKINNSSTAQLLIKILWNTFFNAERRYYTTLLVCFSLHAYTEIFKPLKNSTKSNNNTPSNELKHLIA